MGKTEANGPLVSAGAVRTIVLFLWFAVGAGVISGCAASGSGDRRPQVYAFWPQFPAEPRVQFLTSYQYSSDIEPPKGGLDRILYGEESPRLPINKPYGVDMVDGRIYVCDTRNQAVVVLDLKKHQTRLMGVTGMGRLQSPTDVAIAPDGLIYVSDAARGVIFVYGADERHVISLGYEGLKPIGLAVYGDELYVCDFITQRVQILDRHTGKQLRTIGERGDQDGQFIRPLGIDIDARGNAYVSDVMRCRVQKFSREGKLLDAFGTIGDSVGDFVRPKHLAVDRDGIIYVVDASFQNVQMFNEEARVLMSFGGAGEYPGSMNLPAGICVHEGDLELFSEYVHPAFKAERLILVTSQFGPSKVAVYAMGRLREGMTPQDVASARAPAVTGDRPQGLLPGIEEQAEPPPGSDRPEG